MEREDREEQEDEARRLSLRSTTSLVADSRCGTRFSCTCRVPLRTTGVNDRFRPGVINPDPTGCPCLDGTSTTVFHNGLWVSGYCCLTPLSSIAAAKKTLYSHTGSLIPGFASHDLLRHLSASILCVLFYHRLPAHRPSTYAKWEAGILRLLLYRSGANFVHGKKSERAFSSG
jgi:hypothetical protein